VVVTEMLLYLYAESPVHAGGSGSLGALDLPVQREATTRYPVIWGQSLKGALRQAANDAGWEPPALTAVFGSEVRSGEDDIGEPRDRGTTPGRLNVGDAQLVAMPVPTLQRTFAWVTSQLALTRLDRKYRQLPAGIADPLPIPATAPDRGAASSGGWVGGGRSSSSEVLGPCLVDLGHQPNEHLTKWATRLSEHLLGGAIDFGQLADKLREDLLLVGSDIMPTLLSECTEFVARVQLSKDKTVEHGPFYSEYLPAETILAASLSLRDDDQAEAHIRRLRDLLDGKLHQIGGDETLGKGLVWVRLVGGAA
jgi:CRISPR-associated protein Cmr4